MLLCLFLLPAAGSVFSDGLPCGSSSHLPHYLRFHCRSRHRRRFPVKGAPDEENWAVQVDGPPCGNSPERESVCRSWLCGRVCPRGREEQS